MERIKQIVGREILNAKGRPTVEATLITENGIVVKASVPSGTSKGKYEAHELLDNEDRYDGRGTRKAAYNITTEICAALKGRKVDEQEELDNLLCELDGTKNKERLGANAILATSIAIARAGAISNNLPLYKYLQTTDNLKIPNIAATLISGGQYSTSGLDFEDYMILLNDFESFSNELEALVKIRSELEKTLKIKYGNFPEDGGALAPDMKSSDEAFDAILETAKKFGYRENCELAIDVAASALYDEKTKLYTLSNKKYSREQLTDFYIELCKKYPLTFIEDGFDEDDFIGFRKLKERQKNILVVGDDLYVTNKERLLKGIETNATNAILIKVNQIGTVSETISCAKLAANNNQELIVSLRSGETEDDFISDLAVAIGAPRIKLGSPVRLERITKYNRLLKIAEEIGK